MWLIGMMGSGKSTVGRLAADRLDVPFYDTDRMVEESARKPIAEVWGTEGETAFRDLETSVIQSVPDDGVAAAGGGAVTRDINRAVIARSGIVAWLQGDVEELTRRVTAGNEPRPLLDEVGDVRSTLRRLLEERTPLYRSLSTHEIDTNRKGLEQVVAEVVSLWPR